MKYEFVTLDNPILLPDSIRRCPNGFDWAWADNVHWFAFTCEAADKDDAEEEVAAHFSGWFDKDFAESWAEEIEGDAMAS